MYPLLALRKDQEKTRHLSITKKLRYLFLPYVHLLPRDTKPPKLRTTLWAHIHRLWDWCCLSSNTCLEITAKKGRQVTGGRVMQEGEKGIRGWGPHPTETLAEPWETQQDILSRWVSPLQRKSSRELKAALGGKGAGVKAVLTAQPEKKSRCTYPWTEAKAIHGASLTRMHVAHLLARESTLAACTHWNAQTHWLV